MSKPITNPTTYANENGNQPATQLDTSFANAYGAINDIITYANGFNDTGAVNAYVITIAAPLTFALATYVRVQFKVANTNGGASTLAVNGGAATPIVNQKGNAFVGGELLAGRIADVQYDGTNWQLLSTQAVPVQPTRTIKLSGSGTYTTPAGATRIFARGWGSGSGGGGGGATSTGAPVSGNATTFGTALLTANGGNGAAGGTATGGDLNITGGTGNPSATTNGLAGFTATGGVGGGAPFIGVAGAGGTSGGNGGNAPANSGGGGGSGSGATGAVGPTAGGGAGYFEKLIVNPNATYAYAVGAAVAGSTGTGGGANTGGTSGSGLLIVDENYT